MYSVGLDIGTNSVGWAVLGEDGHLVKKDRKNMWGVRLFEDGKTAQKCRIFRSTRRRYSRRRQRIECFRNIIGNDVLAVDKDFFIRLDEAFLWEENKSVKAKYLLFDEKTKTDIDYYKDYKTIYHLRKRLLQSEEKADIREIYLAIHHILKYRGHFLYQGKEFNTIASVTDTVKTAITMLNEQLEEEKQQNLLKQDVLNEIEKLLAGENSRKDKSERIEELLCNENWDKKYAKNFVSAMLGMKFNVALLLGDSNILGEDEKELKISFEDPKYEEKEEEYQNQLEERYYSIEELKKIYSWVILQKILCNKKSLSEAMVEKYEKHNRELNELKDLFKDYATKEEKIDFFRNELVDAKGKYVANYANYIKGTKRCGTTEMDAKKNLYKTIESLIGKKAKNDVRYQNILKEIEKGEFLAKQNEVINSYIPYQLNKNELVTILEQQGKYYPILLENKEKIVSLLEFRIPYFVGPLNPHGGERNFSWISKREGLEKEKIYPWNFEKIIDIDETAEKFMLRMTGFCTYLPTEKVLPKYSLLYSEFEVLQELNKIKINGKGLNKKDRDAIMQELFCRYKTVKCSKVQEWLLKHSYGNKAKKEDYRIKGTQKQDQFATSLTSYIDFKRIFGHVDQSNIDMIEELIYWLTVFEEKSIVKRKIKQKYEASISNQQLRAILKLRYKGWGRLSKKFLSGVNVSKDETQKKSVIEVLRTDEELPNLMQLLHRKDLKLNEIIEKNRKRLGENENLQDAINQLYGSPAIKRGVWQSLKLLEEIIQIMGEKPEKVYLEFAREDKEKLPTKSRGTKLDKAYQKLSEEIVDYNKEIEKKLKNDKIRSRLSEEMVFLYFIQNGKSLYTGKPLPDSLDKLSSECEVDHIIPRSVVTDNSLDNKALVLKGENQAKGNKLVLEVFDKNAVWNLWKALYNCNLISEKKFANLQKESIGEVATNGFINRQLVETRQIVKAVANIIRDYYKDEIGVMEIKATLNSDLRKALAREKVDENGIHHYSGKGACFYKNRELNDFHHAHDAYLSAIIGKYILSVYPNWGKEIDYNEYRKEFKKYYDEIKQNKNYKRDVFSWVISKFNRTIQNSHDEKDIIWDGKSIVAYMEKAFCYRDVLVTKKIEENTGEFYNDTIYPKSKKENEKLIPLKKGLSTEKYGGYKGGESAYFMLVQYTEKKKIKYKLVGIPVYVEKLQKEDGVLDAYVKEDIKTDNYIILRRKIRKYQLLKLEDGSLCYLTAASEITNAKQLVLGGAYQKYNWLLAVITEENYQKYDEEELHQLFDEFYHWLINKLKKEFSNFLSTIEKIESSSQYELLETLQEKGKFILELLKLGQANSNYPCLKKIQNKTLTLSDRMGRKQGFLVKKGMVLIDTLSCYN